jgi:hypothetical protein
MTNEEGHYRFHINVWEGSVISGLAVTQNSPLGMSVLVGTGDLKIDYSTYGYTGWNDAASAVTIATADGSNPRIDRIVAYVDRGMTPSSASSNNPGMLKFMAVAGTPAGSPSAINDAGVTSAVGASNPWTELARVTVGSGVTTITNSNISDTRSMLYMTLLGDNVVTAAKINVSSVLPLIYPVGSIYTNAAVSTNPATLLGFGTWTAFAAGRVLVGLDSGQTEFDTLEETGGSKTANLQHTHTVSGTTSNAVGGNAAFGAGGLGPDGNHTHTYSATTGNGGSTTQSILQPYITVYMWKRTA